MDKRGYIILTVVLVALVGAGLYGLGYKNASSDSDDAGISGYWYQVGYYGYKNGEFLSSENNGYELGYAFDISISSCNDDLFKGAYCGSVITGTYVDNTMVFRLSNEGTSTWFYGTVDGDRIYAVSTETGDNESALSLVYSRNPQATVGMLNVSDMSGEWHASSAYAYIENETYKIQGGSLTIDESHNGAFIGTMEQMINGSVKEVIVYGAFTSQKRDGYNLGFLMDGTGENWTMSAKNGELILRTVMLDNGGYTGGSLASVERIYTRDGNDRSSSDHVDLTDTTWIGYKQNNISKYLQDNIYVPYKIEFTSQNGNLLNGTVSYLNNEYSMAAYIYDTSPITIGISATYGSSVIYGIAVIENDILTFSEWYDSSSVTFFEKQNLTEQRSNAIQHWYCAMTVGIDDQLEKCEQFNGYGPQEYLYDLTILETNGMFFRGLYNGMYVSGLNIGSAFLNFTTTLDDGTDVEFSAYKLSDNVMISSESYVNNDLGFVEMWSSVYTTSDITGYGIDQHSMDVGGNWISPEGYSYQYNGVGISYLEGKNLSLSNDGVRVYGTMEQEVNGSITIKNVMGIVLGTNQAVLLDDTGGMYNVDLAGDTLTLQGIMTSDSVFTGDSVVVKRVYTRNGSEPTVKEISPVSQSVWKSVSSKAYDKYGVVGNLGDVTISFENCLHEMVSGTVTVNGTEHSFVGYAIDSQADSGTYVIYMSMFGIPTMSPYLVLISGSVMMIFGDIGPDGEPLAFTITLEEQ